MYENSGVPTNGAYIKSPKFLARCCIPHNEEMIPGLFARHMLAPSPFYIPFTFDSQNRENDTVANASA